MSEYGYPKIICYECKEKHGNWCGQFAKPIRMALQTDCAYGINMIPKKRKNKNVRK